MITVNLGNIHHSHSYNFTFLVMTALEIYSLSILQIYNKVLLNYSPQASHYNPRTYLSSNWKLVPLTSFIHYKYPLPLAPTHFSVSMNSVFMGFTYK